MHSLFVSWSRLADALRRRWQVSALRARCLDWDVEFAVHVHTMTLSYPPVAGRHTLSANVRIGHHDLWIQRWHTVACGQHAIVSMALLAVRGIERVEVLETALRGCVAELQAGNRMEDRTKAVIERALQRAQP